MSDPASNVELLVDCVPDLGGILGRERYLFVGIQVLKERSDGFYSTRVERESGILTA